MTSPDPEFLVEYVHGKHTLREYFEHLRLDVFDVACEGCAELAVRCRRFLLSAFETVEAVPRTDPFWAGSNMRTTEAKVHSFYSERFLATQRSDEAWPSFAVALFAGDLDLFSRSAEALFHSEELSVPDFVRTFYNVFVVCAAHSDEVFTALLVQIDAVERVRSYVAALATAESRCLADWARGIARGLDAL